MIDKGPVLLDIADGIARLRLNRPDAANGMSAELLSALCDAIMACHGQPDLRVLLLSGEGTNFCAGGDVRAFASKGEKLPITSGRQRPICRTR
jgi:2-(1,2-epoxy-1,2-dihydrophenyl)acetyl-CoA isomerase